MDSVKTIAGLEIAIIVIAATAIGTGIYLAIRWKRKSKGIGESEIGKDFKVE